jgi:CMP-N-acetylneuraminic acid synthetase
MRILGTICARGGSKGIKNKNIRLLQGKPLISHSIRTLKAWGKADRIICSTDSKEIQEIAREFGAETPFLRPAELATDTAGKLDVYKHMVKYCETEEKQKYDYIVDLDPTSPLRTVKDVDLAFNMFLETKADTLLSAYLAHKNPYFNMLEIDDDGYAYLSKQLSEKFVARQQAPKVYSANASIYVYNRDFLLKTDNILSGKTKIYEMPDYVIDIDRQIDFEFIEFVIEKGRFKFDY